MIMPLAVLALGLWLVALGCGCRDSSAESLPPLVPVSGTVTWEGQPLVGAMVRFLPQEGTPGNGGSATTGLGGTYQLAASIRNQPGVPAGEYRVFIVTPIMMEDYQP